MVRIGSCLEAPQDRRTLSTWLAPEDFVDLVWRVFDAPFLGCPVVYGASANDAGWWDNSGVAYLGWTPKRNAAAFADRFADQQPSTGASISETCQGGHFVLEPIAQPNAQ